MCFCQPCGILLVSRFQRFIMLRRLAGILMFRFVEHTGTGTKDSCWTMAASITTMEHTRRSFISMTTELCLQLIWANFTWSPTWQNLLVNRNKWDAGLDRLVWRGNPSLFLVFHHLSGFSGILVNGFFGWCLFKSCILVNKAFKTC